MAPTSLTLFSSLGLLVTMLIATEAGRKLGQSLRVGEIDQLRVNLRAEMG